MAARPDVGVLDIKLPGDLVGIERVRLVDSCCALDLIPTPRADGTEAFGLIGVGAPGQSHSDVILRQAKVRPRR